jgi:hypothetical protein
MSKPWPRLLGALAGFIVMMLFVVMPEGRKLGWAHEALFHLLIVGAISGAAGAVSCWFVVAVRNKLIVQK